MKANGGHSNSEPELAFTFQYVTEFEMQFPDPGQEPQLVPCGHRIFLKN